MGLFSWVKKHAKDIVDPIGSVVGDNKYVNAGRTVLSGGVAGLSDMGTRRIIEGAEDNGLRGALGGLSDAATWGAGDVIQPLFTTEKGDNPFYDRIGPIAAGYFGGPAAGALADWWAKGSEYHDVADLNLGTLAGIGGSGWGGSGLFDSLFSSFSSGGSSGAGSAGGNALKSLFSKSGGESGMGWEQILPFVGQIVSTGGSIWGANQAADASASAAEKSSATQLEMFYQNRADLAPWRVAGTNALGKLMDKIETGPGDYTKSPGYEFRLGEGENAINRAAAARGQFDSGKTYKNLIRFNQDYATADYDNFLQRWYQSLNPLASVANVGQVATTDTAHMGTQVAGQVGQNQMAAGNARASGYLGTANAIGEGIDSATSNYLLMKYLNKN